MTPRGLQALVRPPGLAVALRQGVAPLLDHGLVDGCPVRGRGQGRHHHTRYPEDLNDSAMEAFSRAQAHPSETIPLHNAHAAPTRPSVSPVMPWSLRNADMNGTSACTTSSSSSVSSGGCSFLMPNRRITDPPAASAFASPAQRLGSLQDKRPWSTHRPYSLVAEVAPGEEAAYVAVAEAVAREEAPAREAVRLMLEEVETEEELDRAMRLLARVRLGNAAVRGQLSNFKETVTEAVVKACLRAGRDDRAIAALSTTNPYGLSCSLPASLTVLRFAAEHKKASLILSSISRMRRNGLDVSPTTADVALRGLVAAEEVQKALDLAQQFKEQGVALKPTTVAALEGSGATPDTEGAPAQ